MSDDDLVMRIGIREVYDAVTKVDTKLDDMKQTQGPILATLDLRVTQLEKDREADRQQRFGFKAMLWGGIASGVLGVGWNVVNLLIHH